MKKLISFITAVLTCAGLCAGTVCAADGNYAESMEFLKAAGILTGYEDGALKPDSTVSRAEAAAMIVRVIGMEESARNSAGTVIFSDVPAEHWASGYINTAVTGMEFVNGMGDGTFNPDGEVTYAQMVKMIVCAIGYGDWGIAYGGYPSGYIMTAGQLKITDGVKGIAADTPITRAEAAGLIRNGLNTPLMAIKSYSPSNPEYVILDGTGGNSYETPLTCYHDIFTVEGRVTETSRTSGSGLPADKVRYRIESTKNYGEDRYAVNSNDESTWRVEEMRVGSTNAAEYPGIYSKALVHVDESGEAVILALFG